MTRIVKEKVVVITGASSGIGAAIAFQYLSKGAKVAVCARNIQKLENCFKDYPSDSVLIFKADVGVQSDCEAFISEVISRWNRIDVLINNAGMSMRALFQDVDLKVLEQLMQVNFWGTIYMTKFALPYIIQSQGSVVGISSIAGYRGLPARTGYSASKFAMNGFLESLRTEMLPLSVNVLTTSPGFTESNIRNSSLNAQGMPQIDSPLEEKNLMSAEVVARLIFAAIEKRKKEIIISSQGKLTVWINKLLPRLADKLVFNHFKKEPNSPIK